MPFWTFPIHIASISSIVLPAERRESLYVLWKKKETWICLYIQQLSHMAMNIKIIRHSE
jgi:hypothetical protein